MAEGAGNGANGGNNFVAMADDRERTITEYAFEQMLHGLNPSIVRPEIQAPQFEFKPVMFEMLKIIGHFSGMSTEEPHLHLRLFMEVSDSFKLPGVTEEALRLKLFPYSLRDKARAWLYYLPPYSITTWNDLVEKFLEKYFPFMKYAELRNDVMHFQQLEGESLYEAWERFKKLLVKCPPHGLSHSCQTATFYYGLNWQTQSLVDAAGNGDIMTKTYNEAYKILERMPNNNYEWPAERAATTRIVEGVHELDAITALTAQVSSLTSVLKSMNLADGVKAQQNGVASCTFCGGENLFDSCPSNPQSACYVGNFNRGTNQHANTYNPNWRQHPEFSWNAQGQNAGPSSVPTQPQYPPGFPQQDKPEPVEPSSSIESLLKEYMSIIQNQSAMIQSLVASLRNLEIQMDQLASDLSNQPQGSLPSETEITYI
ncbi:uncharacterized protein LOC133291129 [Gastrolobium bilobum]|uniref:uncharacterized protein LOC133291129 n=1 Tax=Gastrolobium bilobum TaxID=150636 RepID=UPI002AB07D60|nr:uncharacterized protein LOC133291129 [Gastrolobium bilobum]